MYLITNHFYKNPPNTQGTSRNTGNVGEENNFNLSSWEKDYATQYSLHSNSLDQGEEDMAGGGLVLANRTTETQFRIQLHKGTDGALPPFVLARGVKLTDGSVQEIIEKNNALSYVMQQWGAPTYFSASMPVAISYALGQEENFASNLNYNSKPPYLYQTNQLSAAVFLVPPEYARFYAPIQTSGKLLHAFVLNSDENLNNTPISQHWLKDRVHYFVLSSTKSIEH